MTGACDLQERVKKIYLQFACYRDCLIPLLRLN